LSALTRYAALWLELTALRKAGVAAPDDAPVAVTTTNNVAAPSVPPAEEELHRKARRFAKLLVEEIKLYNQPRVVEGKHNRDLYDRLREDIEKSRMTYQKRYGETPVAAADYFNQELIRILADNDVSLMGASFPR
jgi:predicted NBD/HSP70 family sugar kinase